jgi:hypothetical protein
MNTGVFRCDYCGQLTPCRRAEIYWEYAETLDDGTDRYAPAVYCSDYCGATHTASAGSGRG